MRHQQEQATATLLRSSDGAVNAHKKTLLRLSSETEIAKELLLRPTSEND